MASNTIHCEVIASDLIDPSSLQLDEKHGLIYALTGYRLTRIDLNNNTNNVQIVCQHNRKFQGISPNKDENYSQGESEDEDTARVSNPYEDSEPSTDDDEETIENRRNWRRQGWRNYQLDNPCSILFLEENNQLIILNEGVITFLSIAMENDRPFVQGSSKNIFCYDFDVFNQAGKKLSIQPWSISPTLINGFYVFSLLDDSQLYSLDIRNENTIIEKFIKPSVNNCPYLLFHSQSNQIFVYDSTQILAISINDKTTIKIDLPFINQGKEISAMTVDKTGYIYVLSDSTIFKCNWQSQFHLVQCLGKIEPSRNYSQMIVTSQGNHFYFSDTETGCIYQSNQINK
jgi:hypothetical protein